MVQATVQQQIEPCPGGGLLTVTARAVDGGREVDVVDDGSASTLLRLPRCGAERPD